MSVDQYDRIPNRKAENDIDVELAEKLVKKGTSPKTQIALTASATDEVLGIVGTSRDAGIRTQVLGSGYFTFLCDGSVSEGDRLVPSGAGGAKAGYVQASDDPAHTFVGYALQDASDGEIVQAEFRQRADAQPALTLTPGAEGDGVANAYDVGVAQNPAAAGKWMAVAYSQDGTVATDIDFSLQDGDGTEINASGSQRLLFQMPADGIETLRVLDGSGTLAADVELVIEPLDAHGVTAHETLTFA